MPVTKARVIIQEIQGRGVMGSRGPLLQLLLLKVIGVDKGRHNIATDSGDLHVPRFTAEGNSG